MDIGDAFKATPRKGRDASPVKEYAYHVNELRKQFPDAIVTAEVDFEIASVLFKEGFSKMNVERGIRDGSNKGFDYARAIVESVPKEIANSLIR